MVREDQPSDLTTVNVAMQKQQMIETEMVSYLIRFGLFMFDR